MATRETSIWGLTFRSFFTPRAQYRLPEEQVEASRDKRAAKEARRKANNLRSAAMNPAWR